MLGLSRASKIVCQWILSAPIRPTGTWIPTASPGRPPLVILLASAHAVVGIFVGDARLQGLRRRHVGGASCGVAAFRPCQATAVERAGPLGIELERGAVLGTGLRVVALLQIDQAEIIACVRIAGLELQGFIAIRDGLG